MSGASYRLFRNFHDDGETSLMAAAYATACERLGANGYDKAAEQLRMEIAAALIEVVQDTVFDSARRLADAAIMLARVDEMEIQFV
jgi:hypothetical protein